MFYGEGVYMSLLDSVIDFAIKALICSNDNVREKVLDFQTRNLESFEKNYNKKLDEYEKKVDKKNNINKKEAYENINKAREQLNHRRRTDEELEKDNIDSNKKPRDFQCRKKIKLSNAIYDADTYTGVYILYLNGKVMKCGRAAYQTGVRWRLKQYYNLNYDDRARKGYLWSVTMENRDDIEVSWQCCPVSKCKELEYKLFQKYGKGEWAYRAPAKCDKDEWELLI